MENLDQLRKKNIKETKQKIKDSVDFNDFIVQSINNIDDIKIVINKLAKRLRDWYELYNPEFSRKTEDHEKFVNAIIEKNDKKVNDSMGADLKSDLKPIRLLAKEIAQLYILQTPKRANQGMVVTVFIVIGVYVNNFLTELYGAPLYFMMVGLTILLLGAVYFAIVLLRENPSTF